MMFQLAILPSIVLLIYIYKKDKREKEPLGTLLKCFILGVISTIPALIMESIGEVVIDGIFVEGSIAYAMLDGFLVAAFSEELCKYFMLKSQTWKRREFNCSFDGIVYAVFVSLGFATFENLLYVVDGGLSTAITRIFTAVPGHACDAVFMGYYYSKAKYAELSGDKKEKKKNLRKALLIPILLHGTYDFLLSFEEEIVGETVLILGMLLWMIFVIAMFIFTFRLINKASKNDKYFIPYMDLELRNPSFVLKQGTWICNCRNINYANFCTNCGRKRE